LLRRLGDCEAISVSRSDPSSKRQRALTGVELELK